LDVGGEEAVERFVGGLSPEARDRLFARLKLTQEDADEAPEGVSVTEEHFTKMDLDSDGVISKWEFETFLRENEKAKNEPPTREQLIAVFIGSGVPFVGFGFMDNAIMIIMGEAIEIKLGLMLGITTMAAAAVGNTISDVAGVGMGSYIESFANRMGFAMPALTPQQLDMKKTRFASSFGAAFGVSIGCLLGMFPLLFIQHGDGDADHISYIVNEARLHSRKTLERHSSNQYSE